MGGEAPPLFCDAWVNRAIVNQHLALTRHVEHLPVAGFDGYERHPAPGPAPHEERINVPSIPKYYWRYRMHLTLEDLQQADAFNDHLKKIILQNKR